MVAVVGFGRLMQLHWRTRVICSSLGRIWLLSWVWSLDVTALADPSDLQQSRQGMVAVVGFGRLMQLH